MVEAIQVYRTNRDAGPYLDPTFVRRAVDRLGIAKK